jgi:hypothetical protein
MTQKEAKEKKRERRGEKLGAHDCTAKSMRTGRKCGFSRSIGPNNISRSARQVSGRGEESASDVDRTMQTHQLFSL